MSRGDTALKIFCIYNVLFGVVVLLPVWLFISSNPYYGRVTLIEKVVIGILLFVIVLYVAGGVVVWVTRSRGWFLAVVGGNALLIVGLLILATRPHTKPVNILVLVVILLFFVGLGIQGRASLAENRGTETDSSESKVGNSSS